MIAVARELINTIGGAVILGALLTKSIFDRNTQIHRCPICNLVIRQNTNPCPRCHTKLDWLQSDSALEDREE